MIAGVADTHTALWYFLADPRLSSSAKAFIDAAASRDETIAVSSISLVEVVYLIEKGRVPGESLTCLIDATLDPDHVFKVTAFTFDMAMSIRSVPRNKVPDMPDRMIAATAMHLNVPLLTCDGRIRSAGLATIW